MNNAPEHPARPLLRHDAPGREPRQIAARQEGGRGRHRGHQCRHLGQPFRDAVSRFLQREDQRPARPPKSSRTRRGCKASSSPRCSSAARRSSRPRGAPAPPAPPTPSWTPCARSSSRPPAGDWHSVCLCSDGSYGVEKGLISSFPVRSNGQKLEIVQGVPINEFSRAKIDATVNELKEEKSMVGELLGNELRIAAVA